MSEPSPTVTLEQIEKYHFRATYPGQPFGPAELDEAAPIGTGRGPNPVLSLGTAIGHCLSSTLVNTLDRAHIAYAPLRTSVDVEVGRNERGRLRVRHLSVEILTRPLHEEDRERFDHCVEIFADFCTVSGAVREGIPIDARVNPGPTPPITPPRAPE